MVFRQYGERKLWAEQIPRPYSHPATRKNRSRVGDPAYSRADDHPTTRKTKTARVGDPDEDARSLYGRSG